MELSNLGAALKEALNNNLIFWRDFNRIPQNYLDGTHYDGVNLLLLGLTRQNIYNSRWLSAEEAERAGLELLPDARPETVMTFSESYETEPLQVFNASALKNRTAYFEPDSIKELTELLPLSRIPYKTPDGFSYFNPKSFLSYRPLNVEPFKLFKAVAAEHIDAVRTTVEHFIPGQDTEVFDQFTLDLAASLLAFTLNCEIPSWGSGIAELKRDLLETDFDNPQNTLMLTRACADACTLESRILSRGAAEPVETAGLPPLISTEEWGLLTSEHHSALGYATLLKMLRRSAKECLKAVGDNIAWLRYFADVEDEAAGLEFYATSCPSNDKVNGLLRVEKNNRLIPITFRESVLQANFSVDITFTPKFRNDL